jgi:hypothetical protein
MMQAEAFTFDSAADVLIESSLLVALARSADRHHRRALDFARANRQRLLVPDVVLTEVTYLLRRDGGFAAVPVFLSYLDSPEIVLTALTIADIQCARQVMIQYAEAQFDFVDACLMAFAERLDIARIATFDHRDFYIFRPLHVPYLIILP